MKIKVKSIIDNLDMLDIHTMHFIYQNIILLLQTLYGREVSKTYVILSEALFYIAKTVSSISCHQTYHYT